MKIASVAWKGFAGLADGSLDLARDGGGVPADLVVVTGPPGAGKTRLLEAIIAGKERVAAYGPRPKLDDVLGKMGTAAKITIDWWLSEEERAFVGAPKPLQTTESIYARSGVAELAPDPAIGVLLERYDHDPRHGKVDYIPADRGLPTYTTSVSNPVYEQRTKRLTRGPDKYGALSKLATDTILGRGDPARSEALAGLFKQLCPHLRLGKVSSTGDLEVEREGRPPTPVSRLSMSEKQAFMLAASMVLVGLNHSILLFDTPELYLSGAEARRRLDVLRGFAPANQWIVATSSEEIVAMADHKSLVRLGGPQ
ncbi:hypothetical protein [Polyangium aurulentum]|uniref:hypothetical protein n=1 Tax=Polyangium aurulentum TaxID=2567896 RepID=UPI0010AEBD6F|nr:hypothetical protein [Polyangium aurulentum]UQA57167.1 hypothetical protein E8A73_038645 [Polyangium aurulentum]